MFNLDIAKTNLGLPEVWEFEVVTPLFIGSGDKLSKNCKDFDIQGGRFFYLDISKIYNIEDCREIGNYDWMQAGLKGTPSWTNMGIMPDVINQANNEGNVYSYPDDPIKTSLLNAETPKEKALILGANEIPEIKPNWPNYESQENVINRWLNQTRYNKQYPNFPKDWDKQISINNYISNEIERIANDNAMLDNNQNGRIDNNISELHTFIRNGFGQPFVPGSSLKGVLRTILATQIDQIEGIIRREGMRFNKDFSGDLGRLLLVFDADSNVTDLGLYKGHFRSNGKWKNYYFEALRPGVTFNSKIKIDRLPELIKSQKPNLNVQEVKFFNDQIDKNKSWYELKSFIRNFNEKVVWYQIKCMQAVEATKSKAHNAIVWLKDNVLRNPDQYVQFGGGAGWSSKTGIPAMDKNNQFLQEKRIKNNNIPYPRSVKLVEVDGQNLPMGWVKILK